MGVSETNSDEWWLRPLPFGLLALAVVVGTIAAPALDHSRAESLAVLGLAVTTAVWLAVWTYLVPTTPRRQAVAFIGRTALAFVLTWLNPFYAVFAFVGFLDVFDVFSGRRAYPLVLVVAVTMAGSQSGGLPPKNGTQWAVFVALVVLNMGLTSAFSRMHVRMVETSEQRATTILDLEQANADLAAALADNAALHETVVAQARDAGVQEERQRMAREIHDTIAQSLAGIVTQLQATKDRPDDDQLRARIARATELARDSLAEARRSVHDLAPAPLSETTLAQAVHALVEVWAVDHVAKADLAVTGEVRPLHPEVEATVLRVTQEALANVAKHARAQRVGVTLSYVDDEVILDVRDDGVGFSADHTPGPRSFGLRGMRQRTERLAGALDVETEPGHGTAISMRLPALARGAA